MATRLRRWLIPARIDALWTLAGRGELPGFTYKTLLLYAATTARDALSQRFRQVATRRFIYSPAFVILAAIAIFTATATFSAGFHATRALIAKWPQTGFPAGDAIVGHLVPIVLAFAIACGLVLSSGLPLRRYPWRYWTFFAFKTAATAIIIPLLWIEFRPRFHSEFFSVVAALATFLIFEFAFARTIIWTISDQRLRCPVCLRRLSQPVSIGSWSSVFDPPTTELFCARGHGLLYVPENSGGEPDRWMPLDESWQDLFEPTTPVE